MSKMTALLESAGDLIFNNTPLIFNRLKRERDRLRALAMTDELTGLLRRQGMQERFVGEVSGIKDALLPRTRTRFPLGRSWREAQHSVLPFPEFWAMFIDVDNFKQVNETLGHQGGDRLLVQVAHCLQESTREGDTRCRYGGDEFLVIMPNATEEGACKKAADLQRQLSKDEVLSGQLGMPVTVSIGIARIDLTGHEDPLVELDDAVRRANQQMYLVKRSGKDAIAVAKD